MHLSPSPPLLQALSLAFLLIGWPAFAQAPPSPAHAQPAVPQTFDPQGLNEREILDHAKGLLEQKRAGESLAILESFLETASDTPLLDEAYFLHAAALHVTRQDNQAILVLKQLIEEFPVSPFTDDARLTLGRLLTQSGQLNNAITVLKTTLTLSPDSTTRLKALRLLRDAYEKKGDYASAIKVTLVEIKQAEETERRDLLDYIKGLILQKMDERALGDLLERFSSTPPGDLAHIRLIELHTAQGDEVLAERDIQFFLQRFPNHPYAQTAMALLQSFISKIKAHQYVVAAVLPFSGRMKPFGNEVLNGIRMALDQGKADFGPNTIGLVVKDSATSPTQLLHEFSRVLKEFQPIALIGPLLAKEVKLVAELPGPAEVPFITPTATLADVRQFGRFWFSTALTTALQVEKLVTYAMEDLGYVRFCIVFPQSAYGQQLSQFFQKAVENNGGEIIAVESYPKGTTDMTASITRLKDKDLSLYGEMTLIKFENAEERLVYSPGFDAVFLPGKPADVAFIAAQLAFYDIQVPLLGNNGWNNPRLLKWGRSSIEGGIFGDGIFLQSPDPQLQQFIRRYQERFGGVPSIFAVQAYEAMGVILDAIKKGATSGLEVRNQLFIRHDLPTLGGLTSFGTEGVLDRKLYLIQIRKGRFVQIN